MKSYNFENKNGRIYLPLFIIGLLFVPFILTTRTEAHHLNTDGYWNGSGDLPNNVQHCTFQSNYLNPGSDTVGINVYTPPGYETGNQRYPVIYALHGINGDEYNYFSWFNNIYNEPSLLSLIEGTVQSNLDMPNAIVVFVNGGAQSYYNNFTDQYHGPTSPFPILSESIVMNEVIPAVDAHFRTINSRQGRAIEGFSMGGRGALKFAFKNADQFCSVVGYAGAPYEEISQPPTSPYVGDLPEAEKMSNIVATNAADILQQGLQIRLVVGGNDGPQQNLNETLDAQLTDLNIPHEAELSVPGVGHQWNVLYNFEGEQGLNFHYQCFQAAARPPAGTGAFWAFLPTIIRPEEDPGNTPVLTCS